MNKMTELLFPYPPSCNNLALRSTFEATSCSRVSPIYKQAFNANACEESASGLTLMFMVTVTIAAIGMVMIMLRSAMYPYRSVERNPYLDQDEKMTEYEEYKSYVGYMAEFVNMWKNKDGNDDSSEPTATWSGSMDSKSEEEKPLSPATPAVNWENHVSRPASFQFSPGDEEGGIMESHRRAEPSSLMFSPEEGPERNFFTMRSPLSWSSYKMSPSSQNISDEHGDEEQPFSPETPSISWDNDWENMVNTRLTGASPSSLRANNEGGKIMLSASPDEINDEDLPLSPETVTKDDKDLVVTRSASIPSLHSDSFSSELEVDKQADVADSLLAVSFLGAVLGSPAPNSIRKKEKNRTSTVWHDDGENVDAVPFIQDDIPPIPCDENSSSDDAANDEVDNIEGKRTKSSPSEEKKYFGAFPPSKGGSPSIYNDVEEPCDEEIPLSPESSLGEDKSDNWIDTIRSRPTPKAQSTWNNEDQVHEHEQVITQGRDDVDTARANDQESLSGERSTTKRFNVMRFGTPDFLSPLRRDPASDYKKIE